MANYTALQWAIDGHSTIVYSNIFLALYSFYSANQVLLIWMHASNMLANTFFMKSEGFGHLVNPALRSTQAAPTLTCLCWWRLWAPQAIQPIQIQTLCLCDLNLFILCGLLDWSTIQRVEATRESLQQFTDNSLSHTSPHSELKSFSWIGFWITCQIDIESSTLNPTIKP